jgi:hypothetical protein
MKRLLLLLTLPILACGGLAESVYPTITLPVPSTVATATESVSQPTVDFATASPTFAPIPFPSASNFEWKMIASGLSRPVDIKSQTMAQVDCLLLKNTARSAFMKTDNCSKLPFSILLTVWMIAEMKWACWVWHFTLIISKMDSSMSIILVEVEIHSSRVFMQWII